MSHGRRRRLVPEPRPTDLGVASTKRQKPRAGCTDAEKCGATKARCEWATEAAGGGGRGHIRGTWDRRTENLSVRMLWGLYREECIRGMVHWPRDSSKRETPNDPPSRTFCCYMKYWCFLLKNIYIYISC